MRGVAPRAWPQTALLFAFVATLYASFVGYGFNLDDEGTVLYQILRTFRGERPYLDFHTGYTPAVFYLNAALFDIFGVSVLPIRISLVVVNAASVVLIFRLALRFAPALEAAVAALVYAIYLPFFAGQFASFNIPYPAWYGVCAWLATELASFKAIEKRSRGWLATAGVLAGVAFSFKPNTGLLALGAVILVQLLVSAPLAGRLGALLEGVVLVVAFLAVFAVLTFDIWTEQFFLLGLPLLFVCGGGLFARRRARAELPGTAFRPLRTGFADVGAIVAGFSLVSALWLVYFLPRLGFARFAEEILLLGAGVERLYLIYYPDISAWSAAILAGVLGLGAVIFLAGAGVLRGRRLSLLIAAVAFGALAALSLFGLAPEGLLLSIAMQLENLAFFLIPAVLAAGVLLWLGQAGAPFALLGNGLPFGLARMTAALVFALLLFLQLYPRIDFMHVVISMPSALIVAAAGLRRFELWVRRALSSLAHDPAVLARTVRVLVLLPIGVGLIARAAPFVDARVAFDPLPRWRATTPFAHAPLPVVLEEDRDHDLRELREVATIVSELTEPGEAIFAFPALAIVPFVTDRTTPVAHDYFFPGRPSHADEATMVAQIEAAAPPLVVTLNDRLGYFSASPAYYFILRDYIHENYELVRRVGRFDILARRELRIADPNWAVPVIADADSLEFAAGDYREVRSRMQEIAATGVPEDFRGWGDRLADVDRGIRGVLIDAGLEVAGRHPRGLAAVAAELAQGRRERLLFVRALGEYAGPESLPWLQRTFLDSSGRLRWEAARSINFVMARRLSDRFDLAGDGSGPLWGLDEELVSEEMVGMIDDFVERQRIGPFAAITMAHAGRVDLADQFEYFSDEDETTWWRMVAAFSLVEVGQAEHLETLFDSLTIGTLAAQYVPSLLLDPELVSPDWVAARVARELREGTEEERETAAWMAAWLPQAEVGRALERALQDPDPRVRRAAEWARVKREAIQARGGVPRPAGGEDS
jgi:hypothetical protein